MAKYLIHRHGSNAANQPMQNVRAVAIVTADTREAAIEFAAGQCACECYRNQHLTAVPLSRSKRADREAVYERDAMAAGAGETFERCVW